MKSWKTTTLGVLTILGVIIGAAKTMLDGDPSTNPDYTSIIASITAGVGLIMAKDANVTGGTVQQ